MTMPTKKQHPAPTDEPEQVPANGDQAPASPAAAEGELAAANARLLRLAADFENFKKRARQEQEATIQFATLRVAERLLTVLDSLHLALSQAPEGIDGNWLKGIELAVASLEGELGQVGVERIDSVGQPFDPGLHEAIGSEESEEHPEDTVIAELRRGYRMHDRVLRPALVKLARSRT
ncbi:MAG: nucleotide exchange factor GrpE [Candidatus Dormibacteraceae bacterium]